MDLRSIQPLTEMSTTNLPGGNELLEQRWTYRHLWADCLENVRASTSHNPMGPHGLLQRYLYFYRLSSYCIYVSFTIRKINTARSLCNAELLFAISFRSFFYYYFSSLSPASTWPFTKRFDFQLFLLSIFITCPSIFTKYRTAIKLQHVKQVSSFMTLHCWQERFWRPVIALENAFWSCALQLYKRRHVCVCHKCWIKY
jgi:hypothetical protein